MDLKRMAAAGMIALSLVVGVLAFGKQGALWPGILPWVGSPFGLAFLAAQVAFCWLFDARPGLAWMLGAFVSCLPLLFIGARMHHWTEAQALLGPARYLTGGAVVSGLVLGYAAFKEKA